MKYSCYKINGEDISEFLEDSDNRNTTVSFSGFRYQGTPIKFAAVNSTYTPFKENVGVSNYFMMQNVSNSNGSYNAVTKGFSPLLRTVKVPTSTASYIEAGTYDVYYKNNGKGARGTGTLEFRNTSGTVIGRDTNCPTVIIMLIQGSGGGGGTGGLEIYVGSTCGQGGGNGAALPLIVEMPFSSTSFVKIMRITVGSGGSGGASASGGHDGSNGNDSYLYSNTNSLIATIEGGKSGVRGQRRNTGDYFFSDRDWCSNIIISNNSLITSSGIDSGGAKIRCVPNYLTQKTVNYSNLYESGTYSNKTYGLQGRHISYIYKATHSYWVFGYSIGWQVRKYTPTEKSNKVTDGNTDELSRFILKERPTLEVYRSAGNGSNGLAGSSSYISKGPEQGTQSSGGIGCGGGGGNSAGGSWTIGGTGGSGGSGGSGCIAIFY